MYASCAGYWPTPAGCDALPLKVRIAEDQARAQPLKIRLAAAVPLTPHIGGWDTSSSDADNEAPSETGSAPREEAPVLAYTPLRVQAAPFCPGARSQIVAVLGKAAPFCPGARAGVLAPAGPQRADGGLCPMERAMEGGPPAAPRTTVMMCNVPFCYTSDSLIDLLNASGFSRQFDFVYMPINFSKMHSVGYAFVNLTSHAGAKRLMAVFEGFEGWASSIPAKEACSVRWSSTDGLEENIRRYQNSPIMGPSVPGVCKPVLLLDGVRVPFPEPERQLRTLRPRKGKAPQHVFAPAMAAVSL